MQKLFRQLPAQKWISAYKGEFFRSDITAGITVGIMLIPQGMAYALIAGLPPVYGLYAALLPQVIYAVFGTSRRLAVGPVATDSLLVGAGILTLATQGTAGYLSLALLLAFFGCSGCGYHRVIVLYTQTNSSISLSD